VRVGRRRGERESLAVVWGLPAGALPQSRDTPPFPPTGDGPAVSCGPSSGGRCGDGVEALPLGCAQRHHRRAMGYVAERIAASGDHGQGASKTCQEEDRTPPQWGSPASCLRRRVGRYSTRFAAHGWYHEPHSPVKNARGRKWDTPRISTRRRLRDTF
jgi:hypothetical protein